MPSRYTRPWIFLISDGEPNDQGWQDAAERCCRAEKDKKVRVFAIGTETANINQLGRFSTSGAVTLQGVKFRELFQWLSASVSSASKAAPGQDHQMAATDRWLKTTL